MNRAITLFSVLMISMIGSGCSSQDRTKAEPKKASASTLPAGLMMAENGKHPLAKHIEVAGFRLSEKSQGKLTVQFAIINHSDADISDLGLNVTLKPITAKPDDPGFCKFSLKLPSLGPREAAKSTADCPTTLRIYELPDWQFIRPTYQITSPAM